MIALLVWTHLRQLLAFLIEVWEPFEDVFFLDGGEEGPQELHVLSTHFCTCYSQHLLLGKWLCYLGVALLSNGFSNTPTSFLSL